MQLICEGLGTIIHILDVNILKAGLLYVRFFSEGSRLKQEVKN